MGQWNLSASRIPAILRTLRYRCGGVVLNPSCTLKSPGELLVCASAVAPLHVFGLHCSGMRIWHWSHADMCVCIYTSKYICRYTHIYVFIFIHRISLSHYFHIELKYSAHRDNDSYLFAPELRTVYS